MKVANLIFIVLGLPVLIAAQQITPMNLPAPPDHPGQKLLMLNQRDLLLVQLKSLQEGRELEREGNCLAGQGATKESCETSRIHIEPEQGSDSETIQLHVYYRVTGSPWDKFMKSSADLYCSEITLFMGPSGIGPKWLKWERRDNGDPATSLKP